MRDLSGTLSKAVRLRQCTTKGHPSLLPSLRFGPKDVSSTSPSSVSFTRDAPYLICSFFFFPQNTSNFTHGTKVFHKRRVGRGKHTAYSSSFKTRTAKWKVSIFFYWKSVLFLLEKLKHKQKKKIKVHIGNGTTMVFVSRDVTSMFSGQWCSTKHCAKPVYETQADRWPVRLSASSYWCWGRPVEHYHDKVILTARRGCRGLLWWSSG